MTVQVKQHLWLKYKERNMARKEEGWNTYT